MWFRFGSSEGPSFRRELMRRCARSKTRPGSPESASGHSITTTRSVWSHRRSGRTPDTACIRSPTSSSCRSAPSAWTRLRIRADPRTARRSGRDERGGGRQTDDRPRLPPCSLAMHPVLADGYASDSRFDRSTTTRRRSGSSRRSERTPGGTGQTRNTRPTVPAPVTSIPEPRPT